MKMGILADVHALAEAHDRLFPLSLAVEGTAQIGGIVTNRWWSAICSPC